jgi:hypothetical protein
MKTSRLIPLVFLSACVSLDEEELDVDVVEESLIGGIATTARPEIGQIRSARGTCTATLVGTRYVLTAAHCTGGEPDDSFIFSFVGKDGVYREYGSSVRHNFTREIGEPFLDTLFSTDVALVRLVNPVPSSQADPASIALNVPEDGTFSTLFGYGCQGAAGPGGFKQFVAFLFRSPPTSVSCPGDSGGPGVYWGPSERGGIWGVTQGRAPDRFGHVTFFKPQIEEVMRNLDGQLEIGMTRAGMTYSTITSPSANACLSSCTRDSRCRSWSWFPSVIDGRCSLKEGVPDMTPAAGSTSGVAPIQEMSVDRPGMDFYSFTPSPARIEICAAACARNPSCRAWTYVHGGQCWLKNGVPAAQTCTTCTSGVMDRSYEPGYDRSGRDLVSIAASSPRTCADFCARDQRCRAFSWHNASTCRLKSGVPDPTPSSSVASGVRRGIDVSVARPGGTYTSFTQTTDSPYECQARCARESQCQAWEMQMRPVWNQAPTCSLKSSIPAASSNAFAVSGLKGLEMLP